MEGDSSHSRTDPAPGSRDRVSIASYKTYPEAEKAVDTLADRRFEVGHLAIVGHGLRVHEEIVGRRGYGGAALSAAGVGAFSGAFIGFFLGLFSVVEPLVSSIVLMLVGAVVGAVLGAVIGLLSHAARQGRRDFSSISSMTATSYDVVADRDVAEEARRILTSG